MQMQTRPSVVETATTLFTDPIIPAVRGEFYSYSAAFTPARPLGFLMKCKANKDRPLADARHFTGELDLVFVFKGGVLACAPNTAPATSLLGKITGGQTLNRTAIARADITVEQFDQLREGRSGQAIAEVCRRAAPLNDGVMRLIKGDILAVSTQTGKFGLLLVKDVAPARIAIEACHILL